MTDPGLQTERTALAWQRTGVTGSVVAGSALVAAGHLGAGWLVGLTALVAATSALAVGAAARGAGPVGAGGSPWGRLLAVAAIPVLVAPVGILLAVVS